MHLNETPKPFEEDEEPDFEEVELEEEDEEVEEETQEDADVTEGRVCAVCGTEFTEGHGKAVVCHDCAATSQGASYPEATHPEVNG